MKAAIACLFLSGCLATTHYRPDELPKEGIHITNGEVTVAKRGGTQLVCPAPATATVDDAAVRIEPEHAPVELVPRQLVERIDITTDSPGKTAGAVAGTTTAVVAVVVGVLVLGGIAAAYGALAGASQ